MVVLDEFPNSPNEPFTQTSHVDVGYNCIAWAASDNTRWYEPDPIGFYYWPPEVPRAYTVDAYINLYEHLGYERCWNGDLEPGYEKIAVFAHGPIPTHAARQLNTGIWTSKLGKNIDVEHSIPAIEEGFYGNVVQYLRKQIL
ncbi:MAG: hypothetical protein ABIT05_12655 [Chitinophagaceae bacterium]